MPDGRRFTSRARNEAADHRDVYKAPIPTSRLADRMGQFVHIYTLSSGYRPFGITAIVAGWDTEEEATVDGEVGTGPEKGPGGKQEGLKAGGPYLYMIEPSGSYWVSQYNFMSSMI